MPLDVRRLTDLYGADGQRYKEPEYDPETESLTLADLGGYLPDEAIALARTRPMVWLVEGLLPLNSVNVVAADPKVGKSYLVRTLAYCVATGTPFLGRQIVTPGPVVLYTLEDRLNKMAGLLDRNSRQDAPIAMIEALPEEYVREGGSMQHLTEVLSLVQPRLVIVDMWHHMFGEYVRDMNDYVQVSKMFVELEQLLMREYPQTCVVLTLHIRKPAHNQQNIASTTADILGSTAFRGRPHTMLLVRKKRETGVRYVESEGREGEFDMPYTPTRICPATGLVVVNKDVEEPPSISQAREAHKAPDTVEGRADQLIAGVYRYGTEFGLRDCPLSDVYSWSGIRHQGITEARNLCLNEKRLELVSGSGTRGAPFVVRLHPDYVVPENLKRCHLPRDFEYAEDPAIEDARDKRLGRTRGSWLSPEQRDSLTRRTSGAENAHQVE